MTGWLDADRPGSGAVEGDCRSIDGKPEVYRDGAWEPMQTYESLMADGLKTAGDLVSEFEDWAARFKSEMEAFGKRLNDAGLTDSQRGAIAAALMPLIDRIEAVPVSGEARSYEPS